MTSGPGRMCHGPSTRRAAFLSSLPPPSPRTGTGLRDSTGPEARNRSAFAGTIRRAGVGSHPAATVLLRPVCGPCPLWRSGEYRVWIVDYSALCRASG